MILFEDDVPKVPDDAEWDRRLAELRAAAPGSIEANIANLEALIAGDRAAELLGEAIEQLEGLALSKTWCEQARPFARFRGAK